MERREDPTRPLGENGRELFDDDFTVASATECTGLIPAAPADEAEADSYSDIYDIPLAENAREARHNLQSIKKESNDVNDTGIDSEGNAIL